MCGGDETLKRIICCAASGMLFAVGWWLVIDSAAFTKMTDEPQSLMFQFTLPNIFISVALVMLNAFKWEDLKGEGLSENNHSRAKLCMFLGLFVAFSSVAGSVWVLIDKYVAASAIAASSYPGIALFLSTLLIFSSAMVMRAGRM